MHNYMNAEEQKSYRSTVLYECLKFSIQDSLIRFYGQNVHIQNLVIYSINVAFLSHEAQLRHNTRTTTNSQPRAQC